MSGSEKDGIRADPLGSAFFVFDCNVAWLGHGYLAILSRFSQDNVPRSFNVGQDFLSTRLFGDCPKLHRLL